MFCYVNGVAGQIGYALVPMIARGVMLGTDQPVILHMLDIPPAAEALNGVKMELVDAAFPLIKGDGDFFHSCEKISRVDVESHYYFCVRDLCWTCLFCFMIILD